MAHSASPQSSGGTVVSTARLTSGVAADICGLNLKQMENWKEWDFQLATTSQQVCISVFFVLFVLIISQTFSLQVFQKDPSL